MLSTRIMLLRRAMGLSQLQLAQKLSISPSALGMYEQSRRTPSLDLLISMSQIFNVSLDYLITGTEFTQSPTAPEKTKRPVCSCCPFCCRNSK